MITVINRTRFKEWIEGLTFNPKRSNQYRNYEWNVLDKRYAWKTHAGDKIWEVAYQFTYIPTGITFKQHFNINEINLTTHKERAEHLIDYYHELMENK